MSGGSRQTSQLPQASSRCLAEVAEQHPPPAGGGLGEADHGVELVQLDADLLGVAAALDQRARDGRVAEAEEQQGVGGQAVPACPPRLLVVALEVLGQVVVHHEAHIGLVDSQAEGDRGDDHVDLVVGEGGLHPVAFAGRQAGVVGGGRHAGRRQAPGHLFGALAREAVDDARLAGPVAARRPGAGRQGDVCRPPCSGCWACRSRRRNRARRRAPGGRARRRGSAGRRWRCRRRSARRERGRAAGRDRCTRGENRGPTARRSELRRWQRERRAGRRAARRGRRPAARLRAARLRAAGRAVTTRAEASQPFEKAVGHEPLGRHVEQVELAAVQAREHAPRRGGVERRVVEGGPHARCQQGVDLVLHERDERRDDDAHARPDDGRNLVTQRLAAAGRHEHEGVAAGEQVLHDLALMGPELAKAEDTMQDAGGRRAGDRREGGYGRVDGRRWGERRRRLGVGRHAPRLAHRRDGAGRARRPPPQRHLDGATPRSRAPRPTPPGRHPRPTPSGRRPPLCAAYRRLTCRMTVRRAP